MPSEDLARKLVEILPQLRHVADQKAAIAAIAQFIEERNRANPPHSGESCVAAAMNAKTAALYFDRVWSPPGGGLAKIPPDIGFFGGSDPEIWLESVSLLASMKSNGEIPPDAVNVLVEQSPLSKYFALVRDQTIDVREKANRFISEVVFRECGIVCSVMFDGTSRLNQAFDSGSTPCIVAAISNLQLVDEDKLDWDQVIEFRNDDAARLKFRRLRHWLRDDMCGKSVAEVSDAIAMRMDDYSWALKKHGIQTLTGTISDLLDPAILKSAGPGLAALWVGGVWTGVGSGLAELVAGSLLVGKVAVSLTNRCLDLIDRKRGQGSEVAFVHEIAKLTK